MVGPKSVPRVLFTVSLLATRTTPPGAAYAALLVPRPPLPPVEAQFPPFRDFERDSRGGGQLDGLD